MNRIIVVGVNPGSPMKTLKKNTTIDRLNRWMDVLDVDHWGFLNLISAPGDYSKLEKDDKFVLSALEGSYKVIALGDFVSSFLKKNGVKHFPMPHPSPLNRKLNCKKFEENVLEDCKRFILPA
jgi:hypothetical protein